MGSIDTVTWQYMKISRSFVLIIIMITHKIHNHNYMSALYTMYALTYISPFDIVKPNKWFGDHSIEIQKHNTIN